MCTVWHVNKYKISFKLVINSRRTSRGPLYLMPGPGTGPRPGGWETLIYTEWHIPDVVSIQLILLLMDT